MTSTDPGPLRPTRQRRAVVEALSSFADFRSAQEIHDLLGRRGEQVDRGQAGRLAAPGEHVGRATG